jgi:excisionase family DNA binding protein
MKVWGKQKKVAPMIDNTQRLAFSPLECAALIGVSKNLVYAMIESGQIKSIRAGDAKKRIIIPATAIQEFLATAANGKGGGK